MLETKFFKAEKAAEGVTRIFGLAIELCYLVEGREKALLIDTTTGIGDIRKFCSQLTTLPITVVNTHGHLDHSGGNFVFDEVYINEKDIDLMYQMDSAKDRIKHMRARSAFFPDRKPVILEPEDVTEMKKITCLPINEGDLFDLGGRILEVIETPGHTKGSVSFLDRANRQFFSGDSCNSNTLLIPGHSTSVEEYRETLIKMKGLQDTFDTYFVFHGNGELPKTCIDDVLECCEEILAGENQGVPCMILDKPGIRAKDYKNLGTQENGKVGNVLYTEDHIYKEK